MTQARPEQATQHVDTELSLLASADVKVQPWADQALAGLPTPSAPPLECLQGELVANASLRHVKSRILLTGKTGHGKSSTGNSLAGCGSNRREARFLEGHGFQSTTKEVKTHEYAATLTADISLMTLMMCTLIDSPGLMDTQLTADEIMNRIARFTLAAPEGLDAILCVLKMGRMTKEELLVLEMLERLFGDDIWQHTILVVTHCSMTHEQLANEIESLDTGNKLRIVWEKCDKRAVPIDNYLQLNPNGHTMHPQLVASCTHIHLLIAELEASGIRYSNDSFDKARDVVTAVKEETAHEWKLLQGEREEAETKLLQGNISKHQFDGLIETLREQEVLFLSKKRHIELERLMKALERSEFVKDALLKTSVGLVAITAGAGVVSGALYAVGTAATFTGSALSCAGQAACYALGPVARLGGFAVVGAGLSRWWSVSLSFGGGKI